MAAIPRALTGAAADDAEAGLLTGVVEGMSPI
jgi:hypothetical protein